MDFFFRAVFWVLLALVFYSYIGYGILLYLIVSLKRFFKKKKPKKSTATESHLPEVTLLVPAYNEAYCIEKKIRNSLSLDYPKGKLKFLFITDGSDDSTPDIINNYQEIKLLHKPQRRGKITAVNRAMKEVSSEIVVFSDANSQLNMDAIKNIVRHYKDPSVGVVAGEKRIASEERDTAGGAGEGIYWKYESTLKKWDSELYSCIGAAGELFSIRRNLFEQVPEDTLIEDFFLTMKITAKGFRVVYEPKAFALESPSASIKEELKRKVRIAAGGLQAIARLTSLLNPLKHGILTFQYVSHRVLRWTLAPLALPVIFLLNLSLAYNGMWIYQLLFLLQVLFYICAAIGYFLEQKRIKLKAFFIPYYFLLMNYAVYAGFVRHMKGTQPVVWEKAKRRDMIKPVN